MDMDGMVHLLQAIWWAIPGGAMWTLRLQMFKRLYGTTFTVRQCDWLWSFVSTQPTYILFSTFQWPIWTECDRLIFPQLSNRIESIQVGHIQNDCTLTSCSIHRPSICMLDSMKIGWTPAVPRSVLCHLFWNLSSQTAHVPTKQCHPNTVSHTCKHL